MSGRDHNRKTALSSVAAKQTRQWPSWSRWGLLAIVFFTVLSVVTPDQNPVAQTPANHRAEQINKLFNGPDGSHLNLYVLMQVGLSNPDSFQHQQTTYRDLGEYLVVSMRYLAEENSGQVVEKFAKAKVDLTGKVISILENR